jgi:hypothetical protein
MPSSELRAGARGQAPATKNPMIKISSPAVRRPRSTVGDLSGSPQPVR